MIDGLSSFAKLGSGCYTDHLQRRKPIAIIDYAVTTVGVAAFGLATAAWHVLVLRAVAWLRDSVIGALGRKSTTEFQAVSATGAAPSEEATNAMRNGDRILERAQGESFFLMRKITKMQRAIIDVAAERIAGALMESDNVDTASIFSDTLTSLIVEPVAATLHSIEETREGLAKAMAIVASASGQDSSEQLPKPTGMPIVDVNEISQRIVIGKPRVLSFLGKGVLAAHVRRKLETQYDRALLEFLSLYANRLRRWMEQSINALRTAFNVFADMYRAHFDGSAFATSPTDSAAIQSDLRILREWDSAVSKR